MKQRGRKSLPSSFGPKKELLHLAGKNGFPAKEGREGDAVKKWLFAVGISLCLLIGGYLALSYYGVRLVESLLQRVTGPGLIIDRMKVSFTSLSVLGIRYEVPSTKEALLQAEEVRIYPDVFSLLKGGLWIRDVVIRNPFFWIHRSREGRFMGPWMDLEGIRGKREVQIPRTNQEKEKGPIPGKRPSHEEARLSDGPYGEKGRKPGFLEVGIARFRIENGSIDFEDRKTDGEPVRLQLREIHFDVRDLQYPLVAKPSGLQFQGKLKGRSQEGRMEAKGWVDFKTLDMEVPIKIEGVELKGLEPYYRKKVTAEIVAGTVDLDFKLSLQGRKIDAPGEIRLVNLQLRKGEGMVFYLPAKLLLSLLQSKGNELRARFRVKGDLDDPRFNLEEGFLARIGLSLAESLGLPIKGVGEQLVGGSIKGAEGVVEGIKAIGEMFKKKKE